MSECAEQRGAAQEVAAPSVTQPTVLNSTVLDPPWWCTENSAPPQTCARQISLCQGNLKDLAQDGRMKRAKCVPRDHAQCFARQLRQLAQLECAPELLDCRHLRDGLLADPSYGVAKTDCAERP
jgi:hypothetical protein